jgi:hypothetical protein
MAHPIFLEDCVWTTPRFVNVLGLIKTIQHEVILSVMLHWILGTLVSLFSSLSGHICFIYIPKEGSGKKI